MNEKDLENIHALYCAEVNLALPYDKHHHEADWTSFLLKYTAGDLILVIKHLRWLYAKNEGVLKNTLRFRHLIRNLDYFAEYLAEARARARNPRGHPKITPDGNKEAVLRATGRAPASPPKPDARHAAEVVEKLKQWKKEQGWEP